MIERDTTINDKMVIIIVIVLITILIVIIVIKRRTSKCESDRVEEAVVVDGWGYFYAREHRYPIPSMPVIFFFLPSSASSWQLFESREEDCTEQFSTAKRTYGVRCKRT